MDDNGNETLFDGYTLYQMVNRLTGDTTPYGAHDVDAVRLENLKTKTDLVGDLMGEVLYARDYKGRHEISMRVMGEFADNFLKDMYNYLHDIYGVEQ